MNLKCHHRLIIATLILCTPSIQAAFHGLDDFLESIDANTATQSPAQSYTPPPPPAQNYAPALSLPRNKEQWVQHHRQTSALNDLSFMYDCYEPVVTNLKTGQRMSIDELVQAQYSYISHWTNRHFNIIDSRMQGNRVEIRSRYTCTNKRGKTVSGYCKTTWVISPGGKISGFADDSSTNNLPAFSAEVLGNYSTPSYNSTGMSEQTARRWAEYIWQNYHRNDLNYMRECYASVVSNLKTSQSMSLNELIQAQYTYTSRWINRHCSPIDFAWSGNRVEARFRYTCTNTRGKTVSGYCKATIVISPQGRIIAYADDSSTKSLPLFSPGLQPSR